MMIIMWMVGVSPSAARHLTAQPGDISMSRRMESIHRCIAAVSVTLISHNASELGPPFSSYIS